MKRFKLGSQLNISFAVVLFIPMIIATVFSIVYYSSKIQEEAINTISSDLKTADIIYQNSVLEMKNLANAYAQKKILNFLIGYNLGEKIGDDWAKSARFDNIDMIIVVDATYKVLVRSHAPQKMNDVFPHKDYVSTAFFGMSASGTEVLDIAEITHEGFIAPDFQPAGKRENPGKVLAITGVAPVRDRQRENIVGAIIVRRILNKESEIVKDISKHLDVRTALFEHTRMVAWDATRKEGNKLVPPSTEMLKNVLEQNTAMDMANIRKRGSISKYMPINDFSDKPVGVLMVQTGVDEYLRTRNTAIITLLVIFLVGFILAFTVKTIIERRIVLPLQRLRKGTERIGSGDYQCAVALSSGGDEIGELIEAFNLMGKDLQEYDKQLKEYNLQLEERVRERTSELQVANEQLTQANTVLEDTMERLNPGVSKLIGNNSQQLGLVYATELVADVCNYTKLNMILGETMMGEFMRKFFRESHIFLAQYRGMFDKTVGDQIVAIFGTPKDQAPASPTHAFDAVACALKLVEATEVINVEMQAAIQDNYSAVVARHKSLSSEDRESIRIEDLRFRCRVGINTSNPTSDREIDRMRMVMMGAETCVDYTAQGGAVIYAFRLESSGTPGKIHIGENTKRLVERMYRLKKMPPITLKGLGIQPGYWVVGYQSFFDSIYPKTRFYQQYYNNMPRELLRLINTVEVGKIQIKEIRKINEYLDINIPYLEHLAGFYNLSMARAILSYAVGESLGMDTDRLHAMLFASLWHNAVMLRDLALECLDFFPIHTQVSDSTGVTLVETIMNDLGNSSQASLEGKIITLCNQFDHKVFDRAYLKNQDREIISAKKAIALMRTEKRIDEELIDILADLMIALEDPGEDSRSVCPSMYETTSLPKDVEHIACEIEKNLSPEQQEELISRLRSDGKT